MKFAGAVYTEFTDFLPWGRARPTAPGRGWLASTPRRLSIRSRLTPIWPGDHGQAVVMLAGFAALAGLFLAATIGGLLVDGFDQG